MTFKLLFASLLFASTMLAQTTSPTSGKQSPAPGVLTAANAPGLPTEDTVNSFLFQMLGYDPTVTWKVTDIRPSQVPGLASVTFIITNAQGANQNHLLVSTDGKHAIAGEVLPFGAHPFEETKAKLEKGVNGAARGPEKAAVTVVEFSDMQCPHCAKAAPAIDQLLAQEPDVRFVFQNFPLPSHDWAEKAAGYVDCLGRPSPGATGNEAVWKFVQKTFEDQANITAANVDEKLKAIATAAGAKGDEIAACAIKADTKSRIEASIALGKSVGVTGTPAVFIDGQQISGGAPVELLKKIVDFKISQGKTDNK